MYGKQFTWNANNLAFNGRFIIGTIVIVMIIPPLTPVPPRPVYWDIIRDVGRNVNKLLFAVRHENRK